MAPAEDTTGNWDTFIHPNLLDDLHSASPLFLALHSATSVTPSTCDLTMGDFPTNRRVARAIHDYATASGHASVLLTPTRQPAFSAKRKSSNNQYPIPCLAALDLCDHIGNDNATRDQPAREDCDDVFINSSPPNEEAPLSPLSICSPWNGNELGPIGCLSDGPFGPGIFEDHQDASQGDELHPSLGPFQWTSPTSTDTDLDESPSMFSSLSSLSPEDEYRHSSLEDDDTPYASSSPPMPPHEHTHNSETIYHPLEQYPSSDAFDLYHSDTDSDGDLSPLSPLSQPSPLPLFTLPSQSNFCNATSSSSLSPPPSFGLGLSPYLPLHTHTDRSFFYNPYIDHETEVPCSPSRRRSMDLPSFEDDVDADSAFSPVDTHATSSDSQLLGSDQQRTSPPARATWLSLPGADTDDSLVCSELALKPYNPDPTSTISSTPPAGLLLWDAEVESRLTGPGKGDFRPPSPEDFVIDPDVVARIAGDEGEKVYWLRERTAAARKEKWEKEKYGELSALLRLKLEALSALDRPKEDQNAPASPEDVSLTPPSETTPVNTEYGNVAAGERTNRHSRSCSLPVVGTIPEPVAINIPRASTGPSSSTASAIHKLKPRITSMAQLVANMVFQRQQQPEASGRSRRTPRRMQSQYLDSTSGSPPPAKTPKSPLRQMLLSESDEDDDDESGSSSGSYDSVLEDATECESPLPLSPLALSMMPLPLSFEGGKHE